MTAIVSSQHSVVDVIRKVGRSAVRPITIGTRPATCGEMAQSSASPVVHTRVSRRHSMPPDLLRVMACRPSQPHSTKIEKRTLIRHEDFGTFLRTATTLATLPSLKTISGYVRSPYLSLLVSCDGSVLTATLFVFSSLIIRFLRFSRGAFLSVVAHTG